MHKARQRLEEQWGVLDADEEREVEALYDELTGEQCRDPRQPAGQERAREGDRKRVADAAWEQTRV